MRLAKSKIWHLSQTFHRTPHEWVCSRSAGALHEHEALDGKGLGVDLDAHGAGAGSHVCLEKGRESEEW